MVDVSGRAIEETATIILEHYKELEGDRTGPIQIPLSE
jgi:regulator of PEP synthase PpsR (kinase-PPPase family)